MSDVMLEKRFICDDCEKSYVTKQGLTRHFISTHSVLGEQTRASVSVNRRLNYIQSHEIPEALPTPDNLWLPPSREELLEEGYDEASINVVRQNWRFIGTNYRKGPVLNRFNVRLKPGSFDMANVARILRAVHSDRTRNYKLNLTWGCLLYHTVNKKFHYFWGGNSSSFNLYFPKPIPISCSEDLEKQIQFLDQSDLVEFISQCRTDTKWVLHSVLNLSVLVYNATEMSAPMMGGPKYKASRRVLIPPEYVRTNRHVRLQLRHKNGSFYSDGLCFFRALSAFLVRGVVSELQKTAKAHSRRYGEFLGLGSEFVFNRGLTVDDLLTAEKCFKIRIAVYRLNPGTEGSDSGQICAELVRRSYLGKQINGDLYLDLCTLKVRDSEDEVEHLSWITSIKHYCKRFYCECGYTTKTRYNHLRHLLSCAGREGEGNRAKCPKSAAYTAPETVFDRLRSMGFEVGSDDKYVDFFSSYDWESFSRELDENDPFRTKASKLDVSAKLELMACSLCSSVEGYEEPEFFLRKSTEYELMTRVLDHMLEIADKSYQLLYKKLEHLFQVLTSAQHKCDVEIELTEQGKNVNCQLGSDDSTRRRIDRDVEQFYVTKKKELHQLESQLHRHAKRHCFYAFNAAKFDVRLMRNILVNCLMDRGIEIQSVLKRDQEYIMMSTETLVFKDAAALVGPHVSLDNLARSLSLDVAKGCFPFDWLISLNQLSDSEFPAYSSFYNSLKQQNVSVELYEEMKKVFYGLPQPRTMASFLGYYTNMDSKVLQESLNKLFAFWRSQDLDAVSEAVSLPGLSAKLVDKMAIKRRGIIWLPSTKKQLELYDLFTKGIIGGPSIVWMRAACAGVTVIRGNGALCESVIGLDANALYLSCIGTELPTGPVCDWKYNEELGLFTKYWCLPPNSSMGELELVTYLQYKLSSGNQLLHRWNKGQVRLGARRYTWDALHFGLMLAVSFDGCRYHFCYLCKVGQLATEENPDLAEKRRCDDDYRDLYVRRLGFMHLRITGCQWSQMKRENMEIKDFLNDTLITPLFHQYRASESSLLKGIEEQRLFGVCEVDLECDTPEKLEKFRECSPIFSHFEVGREHLSDHMREVVERSDALKNPRKCLVGVRSASHQVMPSRLVAWYMEQGLTVKLHRFIQSKPCKMYTKFVETITRNRSLADSDPNMAVIAAQWKLAGKSCYGKFAERVENHMTTKMCTEKAAGKMVNLRNFRHLEPLGENEEWSRQRYECHLLPRSYIQRTPRQLALFVLGMGKLSLLDFVYSFLRRFWKPEHWCLCYCDTDSWYLCLAAENWQNFEKLVIPELKEEFELVRGNFIADEKSKRVPGLYKQEFAGAGIVCLNAKSYVAFEKVTTSLMDRFQKLISLGGGKQEPQNKDNCDGGKLKISCKGLSKAQNKELLTVDSYLSVLETEKSIGGRNQGFMFKHGALYRYTMDRQSLSYTYIKRKLDADGITASEPII